MLYTICYIPHAIYCEATGEAAARGAKARPLDPSSLQVQYDIVHPVIQITICQSRI